jgi:50S ribosomal protein L16 3-hydroxylase
MLYLPPGVPHHGEALDACLTYSIGMRAPSQAEMLIDFAEHLAERLPESLRYRDPDLTVAADAGEIDDDTMQRVLRSLPWLRIAAVGAPEGEGEEISQASLRTWFGCFITRYRHAGDIAPPPRVPDCGTLEQRLAAGATLHRHPHARSAFTRHRRGAELFVDGDSFRCSISVARRLSDPAPLDHAAYNQLDRPGKTLVHTLLARGTLALSRVPRRTAR